MSITQNIVGRLHISASNREVIREIRKRLAPKAFKPGMRKTRHFLYRQALAEHASNGNLYHLVMGGHI